MHIQQQLRSLHVQLEIARRHAQRLIVPVQRFRELSLRTRQPSWSAMKPQLRCWLQSPAFRTVAERFCILAKVLCNAMQRST